MNLPANAGDTGSIPGSERYPGTGGESLVYILPVTPPGANRFSLHSVELTDAVLGAGGTQ